MAKHLEFKEYTASIEDEDGDSHPFTVRAAVVTKDTARTVTTRVGTQKVNAGDAVIETERPGVYDVLAADSWKATGYVSDLTPSNTSDRGANEVGGVTAGTDKTTNNPPKTR